MDTEKAYMYKNSFEFHFMGDTPLCSLLLLLEHTGGCRVTPSSVIDKHFKPSAVMVGFGLRTVWTIVLVVSDSTQFYNVSETIAVKLWSKISINRHFYII